MNETCRFCSEPCDSNDRLIDRNFREKAQDIFVLLIGIANKYSTTVCDSCQSQVERFYLFKRKCRQQEELRRDPKPTVLSTGFAVKETKAVPPAKDSKQECKAVPGEQHHQTEEAQRCGQEALEPTVMIVEEKPKKKLAKKPAKKRIKSRPTRTWTELYKERYYKVCELCGKSFPANHFDDHKNVHRGVRPYACEVPGCVAKFYAAAALKGHVKRAHADGHFPCPDCDKVFTSDKTLATHRKIHGEKPFECEICHLRVRLRYTLSQHMLIHTQQRDHKCEFCGKAFYARQVLTLHLRSHTGERPYACHVCDFSHAHRILYVKHMQKFHPGEEIRTLKEMKRLEAIASEQQNGEKVERLEQAEINKSESGEGMTYRLEEIEILGNQEEFE